MGFLQRTKDRDRLQNEDPQGRAELYTVYICKIVNESY